MIDFSKLTVPSAEERAAREQRRIQEAIVTDRRQRNERSKKSIQVTLLEDAFGQFSSSGVQMLRFYRLDDRRRRVSVTCGSLLNSSSARRSTKSSIISPRASM